MSSITMSARSEIERRLSSAFRAIAADGVVRTRSFALGDPQTSFDKVMAILARHQLLDGDGMLRREVCLLSIGDHFDYGPVGGPSMGREGLLFLRWLAEHPRDQVVILAGNHDLARVQELALETDASFAEARAFGEEIRDRTLEGAPRETLVAMHERFHARFPNVPTPEIAARDYSGFSEEQRAFVQTLLLERRMLLSCAGRLDGGREILFSHAAMTSHDLSVLGVAEERSCATIAEAANAYLAGAVERVAPSWRAGALAPLKLSPLHEMGVAGREGGGLLYHRPAHPTRPRADVRWEFDPRAPRRFDPRTLPLGVVQVCGHSGHKKLRVELDVWVTEAARAVARGGLRTLRTDGDEVEYDVGVRPPRQGEATVYFIDGEIDAVDEDQYALLPFRSWA